MKYYRVLPKYDNYYKNPRVHDGNIYVGNQLYTPREVEKYKLNTRYMELVDVSKSSVYFSFGCRFSSTLGGYRHD